MTKIAVITGTSSGIGEVVAQLMLEMNWEVYGISRSECKNLANNRNFHQVICDLSSIDHIKQALNVLPDKIDALINNAGVWELIKIKDATVEHLNKMIDTNLRAPIYLSIALLPRIAKGGHIINVSSILSRRGEEEYGIYASAKAGIDRFTTTLAKESKDLVVCAILPSATDTPGNRAVLGKDEDYSKYVTSRQIANVAIDIINDRYESGSLIVIYNKEYQYLWKERDKYLVIQV